MSEPFDDRSKVFYRRFFEERGMAVETQLEVFFRSRTIDLVVRCTDQDRQRLKDTVFAHFRQANIVEFKGIQDPLTLTNYHRIMMRAWGLGGLERKDEEKIADEPLSAETEPEQVLLPSQYTVTVVCVVRPMRILDQLQEELRFLPTEQPGVYYADGPLRQWIIHPTELSLTPANYPLLPLARGAKLARFIEICVQEGLSDYLQLVLDVGLMTDPNVIWRKLLEMKQMKPMVDEETWPLIDQFFREMPEAIRKLPSFQEALLASQLEGKALGEAYGEARGEQRGLLLGRQQTLLRLMRHKFGEVPQPIVKQIEATANLAQLDRWLDQVLDADSLVAMNFFSD